MPAPPVAYSYQRFSSRKQREGSSLERQGALRDTWLQRNGLSLDNTLTLRDEGISAFRGKHRGKGRDKQKNPDMTALEGFLAAVESGQVPPGSFLIVESLDRLTREHVQEAMYLILGLTRKGVRIVQLLPVEMVYDAKSELHHLMMMTMELSRGNSESRVKSERIGEFWEKRRKQAAAKKELMTAAAPGWLEVVGGRFRVREEAAEAVRLIYRLAAQGWGLGSITKKLNAEKVPTIGRRRKARNALFWGKSTVARILSTRAVLGEFQPYKGVPGDRKPHGPPIKGYFPAIVTDYEWLAAQGGKMSREGTGGRSTEWVNLFTGLLRDARDGSGLIAKLGDSGKRWYVSNSSQAGATKPTGVKVDVFEEAVLSRLEEIDPRELIPKPDGVDRVQVLTGELATVVGRIGKLKGLLESDDDLEAAVSKLREWEGKRKKIVEELNAERIKAATPLTKAWGECQSLITAARGRPEDRLRLRAALGRIIAGVWCLVVTKGRGWGRLAMAQIWFEGGGQRVYMVYFPRGRPFDPRKDVRSLAYASKAGRIDLRDQKQAARAAKELAEELEEADRADA
jgi:DNA invertase Pin-like site-specific DNA recombinase